ncbi:MAG: DUF1289 domain-containing protein [Pseudomonadales bacterium]|nr:DUF1289 domain-containing protein [Pseudomonadales bacterium]
MVESMCISVCVLDENEICLGCYRSLKEIGDWSHLNETQKKHVNDAAEQRQRLDCQV